MWVFDDENIVRYFIFFNFIKILGINKKFSYDNDFHVKKFLFEIVLVRKIVKLWRRTIEWELKNRSHNMKILVLIHFSSKTSTNNSFPLKIVKSFFFSPETKFFNSIKTAKLKPNDVTVIHKCLYCFRLGKAINLNALFFKYLLFLSCHCTTTKCVLCFIQANNKWHFRS